MTRATKKTTAEKRVKSVFVMICNFKSRAGHTGKVTVCKYLKEVREGTRYPSGGRVFQEKG